jgi:colanic acid/amylovoran biosynthesis glycosyltransferase
MSRIAYLVNRYPEASLAAIGREIRGVLSAGVDVSRFAHRPSDQPILSPIEREEAAVTRYLATGSMFSLLGAFLRQAISSPMRMMRASRELRVMLRAGSANVGHLLLACRLVEHLKAARVDCLHVHFAMSSAVVAMLTRLLGGPPWTLTVHGPEEFDAARATTFASLVRAASATVAVSEWAAGFAARIDTQSGHSPRLVRMGVDSDYLSAPAAMDPSGPILCIARLDRRKGHDVLLAALDLIPRDRRNFQIELIGDGPLRHELESAVARHGFSSFVRFRGWLSQPEVLARLDACRCLVMPSLAEGLPVALMEAFARARPVIATSVGGITELVTHRVNGLVVPAGDVVGLSRAVLEIVEATPGQLSEWGHSGRRSIEIGFNSSRNAQALAAIWEGLGA